MNHSNNWAGLIVILSNRRTVVDAAAADNGVDSWEKWSVKRITRFSR